METKYPLRWWQLALGAIVLSAIGGLSSRTPKKKERKLYDKDLKQAPWAPPGWVFGPAWSINNYFLLQALYNLFQRDDISHKQKLLVRQAIIWIIFFSFGYIYFRKKSPILAAIWTISDAALAGSSYLTAKKSDKKFAANYLPLLGWTGFASTIAAYQALNNPDPVLDIDLRS